MRYRLSLTLLTFLGLTSHLSGQETVHFQLTVSEESVAPGQQFEAIVTAQMEGDWHLYSLTQPPPPVATSITIAESPAFKQVGTARQPEPLTWFDPNFEIETEYFENTVDFQIPVQALPTTPVGNHDLEVSVRFMTCNDRACMPPQTKTLRTRVQIAGAPVSSVEIPFEAAPPGAQRAVVDGSPRVPVTRALPLSTLAYLWFSMAMGALALLTPCVFPMIPITVSYFTKRESDRKRAVAEAGLYAVGIILTFTLIGFTLTFLFGAGGINRLAASPFVNILIALIFIGFALSLFGVFEIRLPSSWINAVSRKSNLTGGILGIMLMAVTFSLTSFTCTVPFVGTVMVAALQGDVAWSLMGVTAFATVFAAPFFFLAIFPSLLQSLPKSGNWMNSVKITMGFLELAAALKFISNVDLVYQWELLTRPVFITVWLAIALVTTFYLLGRFRFAHETATESVGAGRVLFSIFFLAVSFYLLRGLFGFPLGELDAFLPPRDYGDSASVSLLSGHGQSNEELEWLTSYEEALATAKLEDRPLFIDFTGYTCTNCRWMESNVFTLPEVVSLFRQFVLVRLYTDGVEAEHERNLRFEQERFGTIALPFYAILSPQDEVIATFPGLTRDQQEFIDFLQQGLSGS